MPLNGCKPDLQDTLHPPRGLIRTSILVHWVVVKLSYAVENQRFDHPERIRLAPYLYRKTAERMFQCPPGIKNSSGSPPLLLILLRCITVPCAKDYFSLGSWWTSRLFQSSIFLHQRPNCTDQSCRHGKYKIPSMPTSTLSLLKRASSLSIFSSNLTRAMCRAYLRHLIDSIFPGVINSSAISFHTCVYNPYDLLKFECASIVDEHFHYIKKWRFPWMESEDVFWTLLMLDSLPSACCRLWVDRC